MQPFFKSPLSSIAVAALIASAASSGALAAKLPGQTGRTLEPSATGTSRVLVTFKTSRSAARIAAALQSAADRPAALAALAADRRSGVLRHFGPRRTVNGASLVELSTFPAVSAVVTAAQFARLSSDPGVARVEPDIEVKPFLDVSTATIQMPAAWAAGVTGAGGTVAVIDTGTLSTHPFIGTGRVVAEACYLSFNGCPNGTTEQTGTGASAPSGQPHGTHVAGIAMGKNTVADGVPKSGVARSAKLISINTFGSSGTTQFSSVIKGLEFVEQQAIATPSLTIGAVNLSLGGGGFYENCDSTMPTFNEVVARLRARATSPWSRRPATTATSTVCRSRPAFRPWFRSGRPTGSATRSPTTATWHPT